MLTVLDPAACGLPAGWRGVVTRAVADAVGDVPVLLCGSRAVGTEVPGSDCDLTVVVPMWRAPAAARRLRAAGTRIEERLGVPVSVNPLPRSELTRARPGLFAAKLLAESVIVAAPPGFTLDRRLPEGVSAFAAGSYALCAALAVLEAIDPAYAGGAALEPRLPHAIRKAVLHVAQLRLLDRGDYASSLERALELLADPELADAAEPADRQVALERARRLLGGELRARPLVVAAWKVPVRNAQYAAIAQVRGRSRWGALASLESADVRLGRVIGALLGATGSDEVVRGDVPAPPSCRRLPRGVAASGATWAHFATWCRSSGATRTRSEASRGEGAARIRRPRPARWDHARPAQPRGGPARARRRGDRAQQPCRRRTPRPRRPRRDRPRLRVPALGDDFRKHGRRACGAPAARLDAGVPSRSPGLLGRRRPLPADAGVRHGRAARCATGRCRRRRHRGGGGLLERVGCPRVDLNPPVVDATWPALKDPERRVARARLGLGDEPVLLLVAAHSARRKGLAFARETLDELRRRVPSVSLLLVGGGDPGELRGAPGVVETGWCSEEDLHAAFGCADVLFVPSRYEQFSRVIVEGWAHELPAVAADGVGLASLVDGRAGIRVPFGDVRRRPVRSRCCSATNSVRGGMGGPARPSWTSGSRGPARGAHALALREVRRSRRGRRASTVAQPASIDAASYFSTPGSVVSWWDPLDEGDPELRQWMVDQMDDLLAVCPVQGRRVLDVATGRGRAAIAAARAGASSVVALDVSAEMLLIAAECARRAGANSRIEFRLGDVAALDAPAATYDVAFLLEALLHMERARRGTVAGIRDVLRPRRRARPHHGGIQSRSPACSTPGGATRPRRTRPQIAVGRRS